MSNFIKDILLYLLYSFYAEFYIAICIRSFPLIQYLIKVQKLLNFKGTRILISSANLMISAS